MNTATVRQLPSPASRGVVFAAGGLLALATLAAYHNSFAVPFLYDDATAIVTNPTLRRLWPIDAVLTPPSTQTTSGRPIVNLSLAINYALSGTHVWSYHVVNLAIHIFAGLTVAGIVRRTLLKPALRERFGGAALALAFAVATVWTLHPLQTESVTYLVQRAESLMGLFYLLTLYCFIRGTDSSVPKFWFTASVMFCFLGMASKEVMVSAPLMILLYDRTFVAGSFRGAWRKNRRLYLALAASWLLLAGLVASTGGTRDGSAGFGKGMSSWSYVLTQAGAIMRYLQLLFWPHPLVFDYGTTVVSHVLDALPHLLLIALLVGCTAIGLWRRPTVGFAGFWFFAILAPSSSIVPVVTETMAEHRMYLPLAAVVGLVVIGSYAWIGRRSMYVFVVVAVLFGVFTARRNEDYRSALAIWSDTVMKWPGNARAHNQLGSALFEAGREPEAMRCYEEALRLKPDDPDAHYNIATGLFRQGRLAEALAQFQETLRLKPDHADAHVNYGQALMQSGEDAEAIRHYREALRLIPENAMAHNNLGVAFAQAGRLPEATGRFEEALRLNPDYAEARNNLGNARRQDGRLEDAVEQFQAALRINPDYAEAHNNLALSCDQLGRTPEAVKHYKEVLRLEPGYADGHYNLGNALAKLGRMPEAAAEWKETLRLKPDHEHAREKLAKQQHP